MERRVIFIGCGKGKRVGKYPTHSLYTGRYFRLCLALARRMESDENIYVLSAKYGVLGLHQRVHSYNLKLSDLSKGQQLVWRQRVLLFVERKIRRGFSPVYVCGELYHHGLPGEKLLPKVGIGKQMQFMSRLLRETGGFGLCTQ